MPTHATTQLNEIDFFLDSLYRLSWESFYCVEGIIKKKHMEKQWIGKFVVMETKNKFPSHFFLTKFFQGYHTSEFSDHKCLDIFQTCTFLFCLKINLSLFYVILVVSNTGSSNVAEFQSPLWLIVKVDENVKSLMLLSNT